MYAVVQSPPLFCCKTSSSPKIKPYTHPTVSPNSLQPLGITNLLLISIDKAIPNILYE